MRGSRRIVRPGLVLAVLLAAAGAGAERPLRPWERVLQFLGVGDTPEQQRGGGDAVEAGDVVVVELGSAAGPLPQRLTRDGGYRSPVFAPDGKSVLALREKTLVRVPAQGGKAVALWPLPGVTKVVGLGRENPAEALVLLERGGAAVLSLDTGKVVPVPGALDKAQLAALLGWDRAYPMPGGGIWRVQVDKAEREGVDGPRTWTEVKLDRGDGSPVLVADCKGPTCGQPSLSPDGKLVVYVQGDE